MSRLFFLLTLSLLISLLLMLPQAMPLMMMVSLMDGKALTAVSNQTNYSVRKF
jgi:hypothetical protein